MAGLGRIILVVVVASIVSVSTAHGFNGRWRQPAPSVSYYYAVPFYYCPPLPVVIPVPDAKPPLARPTPAPPSATKEPPLQKMTADDPRMPVIVTSHASGGAPVGPIAKDRCRVGFWNLSGRDVTLTIDGKAMKLAKDRAVTLDLDRQFAWQVEGLPQHVERVADGQVTHEVVIRE